MTNDREDAEDLVKNGKTSYPDVRIDFGWGQTAFTVDDLEVIQVDGGVDPTDN